MVIKFCRDKTWWMIGGWIIVNDDVIDALLRRIEIHDKQEELKNDNNA